MKTGTIQVVVRYLVLFALVLSVVLACAVSPGSAGPDELPQVPSDTSMAPDGAARTEPEPKPDA